jgi:release factor glutamine methyltransferase
MNNISELIKTGSSLLINKEIIRAEFEAQTLLARTLNKDQVFVIAHPEFKVDKNSKQKYLALINKRLQGWSQAVLLNSKSFYTTDFFVNANVLVPRPETEIMVETILEELKDGDFVFDKKNE